MISKRKFLPEGWEGKIGNLRVKFRAGRKGIGDRVILIGDGDEWIPVTMEAIAGIAALVYHNEEIIYPRPRFAGGKMFLELIVRACAFGLPAAMQWKEGTHGRKFKSGLNVLLEGDEV